MIVIIVAIVFGIVLGCVPSIIWNKRYGKKYIDGHLLPLRAKYRVCSAFGLIMFMAAFLSLVEMLEVMEDYFIVWSIAPAIFMSSNRLFFEPYHTTNIVDKIDELCLYLRPFDLSAKNKGYFAIGSIGIPESLEKLLCDELNKKVAKTYCIGDPNTAIPTTLSASGIYASDEEWKNSVMELSRRSELIVLRIMETEGCMWELHHCVKNYIEKTIFLLSEGSHLELLNQYISERKIDAPNVSILNKGCVAAYYNAILNIWEICLLKNVWDIKSLVKKYIKSHNETADRLKCKTKPSNIITAPFKKMNISSKWIHRLTFFFQPFWYIAYNKWPKWWIIIYVIYELVSLLTLSIAVYTTMDYDSDPELANGCLFVMYALSSLPWVWLAPRITESFNTWGSRYITAIGNITLGKWVVVWMILVWILSI